MLQLLRRLPTAAAVGVEWVALKKAAVAPPSAIAAGTALRGEARFAICVPTEVRFRPARINLFSSVNKVTVSFCPFIGEEQVCLTYRRGGDDAFELGTR